MPRIKVPLYQPALPCPSSGKRTRKTVLMATMRSEMHRPTKNISKATHCQPGSHGSTQKASARLRLTQAYKCLGLPRDRM
ncbi:hypothetical protein D3C72_1448260 [compost metagenome]